MWRKKNLYKDQCSKNVFKTIFLSIDSIPKVLRTKFPRKKLHMGESLNNGCWQKELYHFLRFYGSVECIYTQEQDMHVYHQQSPQYTQTAYTFFYGTGHNPFPLMWHNGNTKSREWDGGGESGFEHHREIHCEHSPSRLPTAGRKPDDT